MQGKVKWFSTEKGYGYIVGETGEEHVVNVRDVVGVELPANGDQVTFLSASGSKGLRATQVVIVKRAEKSASGSQSRIECPNPECRQMIVPHTVYSNGLALRRVCPFCNKRLEVYRGCFIATAVYQDPYAREVVELRRFRDEFLMSSRSGRRFVKLYYTVSPAIASHLATRRWLCRCIRPALDLLARTYR
jgi:cold shock CspA family protein